MSDLRTGSIGAFITGGLFAGACNRGLIDAAHSGDGSMLLITIYGFVISIALFGERAS